jgi:hypothetical protein
MSTFRRYRSRRSESAHRALLLLGDVVHSPVELTDPTWEAPLDVDREPAKRVRAQLIEEHTDQPDAVAAAHFPT